ncbi:unnamed protein product, partial [Urochloa humidicola]
PPPPIQPPPPSRRPPMRRCPPSFSLMLAVDEEKGEACVDAAGEGRGMDGGASFLFLSSLYAATSVGEGRETDGGEDGVSSPLQRSISVVPFADHLHDSAGPPFLAGTSSSYPHGPLSTHRADQGGTGLGRHGAGRSRRLEAIRARGRGTRQWYLSHWR